jgi:hypothetical protein
VLGTDISGFPPKLSAWVAHSDKPMEKSPSVSISHIRLNEEDSSEHSHISQKEMYDAKHLASGAVHSLLTLSDWCGKETPASPGPVITSFSFADENLRSPDIFGRDQPRSLDISPQEAVS